MNRVFVYGSLKKGYWNHDIIGRGEFIGEAKTEPNFTMIDYGMFPACLTGGKQEITGEVYDVPDGILAATDRLEGYPNFYNRVRTNTNLGEAWIYVMKAGTISNDKLKVIEGGVWKGNGRAKEMKFGC